MPATVNLLTLSQQEFEAYLHQNMQGAVGRTFGGTAIGALLGIDPDKKPWDVWDQIMRPTPGLRNRRMDRGHAMEPIIATIYADETSRTLSGDGQTRYRHRDEQFWFTHCTPDRKIIPVTTGGETRGEGVLEIKCLGTRTFTETKLEGIAPKYYAQLQWYLDALGLAWGSFAIFNAEEWQLYWFDVPFDGPFVLAMRMAVLRFWNDHVLTRQRPDDGVHPDVIAPRPHIGSEAAIIEGNATWMNAFAELQRAAEDKKLAETRFEGARNIVKQLMTDCGHERVRIPGVGQVNWTPSTTRTIDRERLAAEHPELDLEAYMRVTHSSTFTFRPERAGR